MRIVVKKRLDLSRRLEQIAAADPKALFTLALSLAEAHEYAEAVRLFQRTNELRPQTYEVLYNLGHRTLQPRSSRRSATSNFVRCLR